MDINKYLKRIGYSGSVGVDLNTLNELHRHHVFSVPFEDIDIHFKRRFTLDLDEVYEKVVNRRRGGFCYELNSLFNELLKTIGFDTKIISGRVITNAGEQGPPFDHMAILVRPEGTRKTYIADVGFGDLFLQPLVVATGPQTDGRSRFKITYTGFEFEIQMSEDGEHYERKYTFTRNEWPIDKFVPSCEDKQVNPNSYFFRNLICTMPTDTGRITIFNDKFTERIGDHKNYILIYDDNHLRDILKSRFGIELAY